MSIFKVLEDKIDKSAQNFSEYLSGQTKDIQRGSEFMLYSLTSIFKDKNIDEIEAGIIDSAYRGEKYDFGIDAIFITASNDFIENPDELDEYNEDTKFKIHLFQFKRGAGISQSDLLKFQNGIKKILIDKDITDDDNDYLFNRMILLNQVMDRIFHDYSSQNISTSCYIVFGGLESTIYSDKLILGELNGIIKLLQENGFTNSEYVIKDCQNLIDTSSSGSEIVDVINYQQTFKYITDIDSKNKLNGYISIINGKDIAELVKKHQSSIFEANIRDYFKRNDLNSKIITTSSNENEAKFFWSYNNGLTMTCSTVEELPNNQYKLYNLQIVNGCQTSNAIYQAAKNKERVEELRQRSCEGAILTKNENDELLDKEKQQLNEDTNILVKIIETKDEALIYRITETTNSQTPIKAFSLKANDDIQKNIEKYMEIKGIAYERRINSLRNKGIKNIYSIQKLFQLYTSQISFKPSQVKTKPKAMFISNYDDVFPSINIKSINYSLYLIPIEIDIHLSKAIKEYLKINPKIDNYKKTLISYGRFHLGVFMLSSILKGKYSEKGIIDNEEFILDELENSYLKHFNDALENFEKVMRGFAGDKKESIPIEIRRTELDNKIVRYVKTIK